QSLSSRGFYAKASKSVPLGEHFKIWFVLPLTTEMEKMMKKYLLTLLLVSLAVSACSAQNGGQSAASIIGAWKLTAYGPASAPIAAVEDVEAGLTFNEDGTVSGSAGCNGLGGDYTLEGDQITFGEFVSTAMACDDPIMAQEEAAFKVMTGTATYKIEGDTLTITNNEMVLVLTRGAPGTQQPEGPASLTGAWRLTSYGSAGVMSSALPDVEATLTFSDDGTVTGTSGCNEFGGNYTVDGDQITFNEIVSTLMLCDVPLMGQEEAMYQVLTETATYQIDGNTLTITNKDRVLVLAR
ncbi:MAG TPA: META domain-containing protein, partial [Anaerolineales bacterium]|nr:META domain-containing protein [Anaerolineales bacterium]